MTKDDDSGKFAAAINCIDGRVQNSVEKFVREYFGVAYVDMLTRPGMVARIDQGVRDDLAVSVEYHRIQGIAVAAHAQCAGNPVSDQAQQDQCRDAGHSLRKDWPELEVISIWVPSEGEVVLLAP